MIIWRGYGWLVPVIVIASYIGTHYSINSMNGDGYFEANPWVKLTILFGDIMVIGLLGYFLNYKYRATLIDEETAEELRSPSHTLFFIPIQYWAIILPVFFFWQQSYSAEQNAQDKIYIASPEISDIYHVDYSKINTGSDEKFKYGLMKVTVVSPMGIQVLVSNMVYDRQSGVAKDISENKTDDRAYFADETAIFTHQDLIELEQAGAIYSVSRE